MRTHTTRAAACAIVFVAAAAHASDDPARDGLLPCGMATHLGPVFAIDLVTRATPPGITFGADGRSLAVGDLDNDGVDDLVMGFAECAFGDCDSPTGAQRVGVVRAFSGADGSLLLELTGQPWTNPAQIDGFGWAIALADLTGDGALDILVGAPLASNARGRVDAFSNSGAHLYSIDGPANAQRYGERILTVGDASRDGRDDFLVLDSQALGRSPTLWSHRGKDGSVMHSRTVLSHRVTVMGDRNNDGVPEYACGSPDLPVPIERARAFRADTGAIAYQLLAAEGFLAWLGDIDDDGFGEFVQFFSVYEWRAPNQYVLDSPLGLPPFPVPRRTVTAADFDADGAPDVVTVLGAVFDVPDPSLDRLVLTSARAGRTYAVFLPRHRAFVEGRAFAHNFERVATGRVAQRPGAEAHDLALELLDPDAPDDRFVVGVYAGPWLPGDLNHDATVDFRDLNIVLTRFGQSAKDDARADADCSGTVDHDDLRIVLEFYGARIAPLARQSGASNPTTR